MLFSYELFKEMAKEILSYGYIFFKFYEKTDKVNKKIIYLRHDVDISPLAALQIGKIENSLHIKANFFFQIGAETYNIFCDQTTKIMKELRAMGHCVGLHVDESLVRIKDIYQTLKWFKTAITPVDYVVSFHRPTKAVILRKFNFFINTYQKDFFSYDSYFSDSRRSGKFYLELIKSLKQNKTPIQLLLHPCWWYPENNMRRFKNILVKRRICELESYLGKNFKKVFKEVTKDENGSFRL